MTGTLIEFASEQERIATGTQRLGASRIAAALGQSPYQSKWALAAELISGEREEIDSEPAEWGTILEGPVITRYAERSKRLVVRWPQNRIVVSEWFPWLTCTPDAVQNDGEAIYSTVQIKTTSAYLGRQWEDEPPLHVQIQSQFEAAILGYTGFTIVALIGGQKLKWFDYPVNQKFIDGALKHLEAFWAMVQRKEMPEADGSDSTADAIARLYDSDNGDTIHLDADALEWVEERETISRVIGEASKTKQELDNKIKAAMGENTAGALPDGRIVTLKTTSRDGYVVKPTTFRTLRITKAKGKSHGDD